MKTPEEFAEEYADTQHYDVDQEWSDSYRGFLAGYQAAKERYEARVKKLEDSIIQSVDAMAGVKYDDENT